MASLEKDSLGKPITGSNVQGEADIYEDEINLIDYFLVLWKRKWFILLATILPTLIIGAMLFLHPRTYKVTYVYDIRDDIRNDVSNWNLDEKNFSPRTYKVTYVYDIRDDARDDVSNWNLDEKNFSVLCSRFYSEENLNKIISESKKNKLDRYTRQIELKVFPSFIDLSNLKVTDPDRLDKLRDMEAFLLNMTITGKPEEYLAKISLIIRHNFEKVTPLYIIREQLFASIREYNNRCANIEKTRFSLELLLNNNNEILAGLKKVDVAALDNGKSGIVLQFDVGSKGQYLPLSYQIQAVEAKIVELQGQLKADAASYKYYKDLLNLNTKVTADLSSKLASSDNYTINSFRLFLIDLVSEYEKQELKDYLASYIKKIENRISVSTPVSENPRIFPVAKGTVKKSAIVFVIALMLSMFAAFLLEGLKKS